MKRDWKKILLDLRKQGISTNKASEIIDVNRTTLQSLFDGVQPRHDVGERLLDLHTKFCTECTT